MHSVIETFLYTVFQFRCFSKQYSTFHAQSSVRIPIPLISIHSYTTINKSEQSVSLPLFHFLCLLISSSHLTGQISPSSPSSLLAVMNNYQAAAAAAHSFGPSASPHAAAATTATRQGFPSTNSPGPTIDMYSSAGADNVGYVQATSPQPSGFPIAVSRAPLNYSPVSTRHRHEINNYP